ncbi:MAG: hypothetical protein AAGF29_08810, partial [Pseudomonadota bacterium]
MLNYRGLPVGLSALVAAATALPALLATPADAANPSPFCAANPVGSAGITLDSSVGRLNATLFVGEQLIVTVS